MRFLSSYQNCEMIIKSVQTTKTEKSHAKTQSRKEKTAFEQELREATEISLASVTSC